jgi:hypothetical protein
VRFFSWRTANIFPHRTLPTLGWSFPLPCIRTRRRNKTHDKQICLSCVSVWHMFAVRFTTTHGKILLKILIFVLLLISPLQNIILYSIIQIYTCLDKFTIFKNYVSLKVFSLYTSNLNCKCIK